MVQMIMQVSHELAKRIEPMGVWLPTIIELSLIGFKTLATATASEVIESSPKTPPLKQCLIIMFQTPHKHDCAVY
jgi:hypothetical protein